MLLDLKIMGINYIYLLNRYETNIIHEKVPVITLSGLYASINYTVLVVICPLWQYNVIVK